MKNRILSFVVLLVLALLSLTFVAQASYPLGEVKSIQSTWTPPPVMDEISPYPLPLIAISESVWEPIPYP